MCQCCHFASPYVFLHCHGETVFHPNDRSQIQIRANTITIIIFLLWGGKKNQHLSSFTYNPNKKTQRKNVCLLLCVFFESVRARAGHKICGRTVHLHVKWLVPLGIGVIYRVNTCFLLPWTWNCMCVQCLCDGQKHLYVCLSWCASVSG